MLVAMTAMLVSVAELSNIVSVVAILMIFCGMVMFIMKNIPMFWIHGEEFVFGSSVHQVQPHIPQMKMMKVHIPFTFMLQESSTSSYEEVGCTISTQVCYRLLAYWGVFIRELHMFLWRPWSAISAAIEQGSLLLGHYQQPGTQIRDGSHGERIVNMSLPSEPVDLGTPPRLCYPLVIFLVRDTPGILHPDETVALINVVHIKDAVCTLPTSILAQYLKQANGQLSCLKQLYLATGNAPSYESGIDLLDGGNNFALCASIILYLVPCYHADTHAFVPLVLANLIPVPYAGVQSSHIFVSEMKIIFLNVISQDHLHLKLNQLHNGCRTDLQTFLDSIDKAHEENIVNFLEVHSMIVFFCVFIKY